MSITFAQISEMDTVEINRSIMELNFRKEKLQREMDGIQATIEHLVAQRTLIQMPDDVRSGQALFDEMFGG